MKVETGETYMASWAAAHLDQLPLGLMVVDGEGRILEANATAASLCGVPMETMVSTIVTDPGLPFGEKALPHMLESDETHTAPCANADSGARFQYSRQSIETNEPGGVRAVILLVPMPQVVADDSARRQLEKLASIDNLVAGVAHELNNPLTAILGYGELLLHRTQDDTTRRRLVAITEESQRCHRIVQNLLTFADRNKREKQVTDLMELISETVALCRYQMHVDHIDVRVNAGGQQPPFVLADGGELQRVFLNLISNAHQALVAVPETDRQLEISVSTKPPMVEVVFRDTGQGVPQDAAHQVFDPFFSTRPLGDGMGLGLSVAFGIVHDHGGRIWLDTCEKDRGATFRLELPFVAP